jgi:uncharacterized protein (TIGR03000 family)
MKRAQRLAWFNLLASLTALAILPATATAWPVVGWRIVIGAPPDPYFRESLENGQTTPRGFAEGYGYYPYGHLPGLVITNQPVPVFKDDFLPLPGSFRYVAIPDSAALFRVRVSEDAEVWFGDVRTAQRGVDRLYVTPPLPAGRPATYEIRARWRQKGKEMDQIRRAVVYPGDRLTVDFLRPASPGGPEQLAPPSQSAK